MSESKVIVALLAGLAAGAALGILFAPDAGTETRNKLAESLNDLGDKIKDSASEHINTFAGIFKNQVVGSLKEKRGLETATDQPDDQEHA